MNRRGFLRGMAGILASGFAPAVIGSGILMPVRAFWTSRNPLFRGSPGNFYDGLQWDADQIDDLRPYREVLTLNQLRGAVNKARLLAVRPEWVDGVECYLLRQETPGIWRF